jgi:hypothetical protein
MKRVLSVLLVAASLRGLVSAGTIAVDFSDVPGNRTTASWSLGWQFDVLRPIWVTRLGFYDDLKNGLQETHEVGIWDSNQVLLAYAVVSPSDPLVSWWRWATLATPVLLRPGSDYRIAAVTGSENYTWDPVGFVVASDIVFVADRWSGPTTSLTYPLIDDWRHLVAWFGPNFEYEYQVGSVVPEPSTLGLVMLGALVLGYRRARRAKTR